MIDAAQLMQLAIDKARAGIAVGQSPFGCAIADREHVLAVCHNTVWSTTDITAHAEINALREACRRTGKILLEDCIVATTCEPCPMCMSALHWARVKTVCFGATIADAEATGFNELSLGAHEIVSQGQSRVELIDNVLADSCRELFREWQAVGDQQVY